MLTALSWQLQLAAIRKFPSSTSELLEEPCDWREWRHGLLCAPVAPPVGWNGEVGEEDGDGQHAHVQVMEQVRHLMEHALPHLPACTGMK